MSFFGITALGPPNSFQTGLVSALGTILLMLSNQFRHKHIY